MAIKKPSKRAVVSYENMNETLQQVFTEKYPHGYIDYMGDIFKVDKHDGSFFHAVSVEVPEEDAIYLVKIKVKTDDIAEMEKSLFGQEEEGGAEGESDIPASDDDFAAAAASEESDNDE